MPRPPRESVPRRCRPARAPTGFQYRSWETVPRKTKWGRTCALPHACMRWSAPGPRGPGVTRNLCRQSALGLLCQRGKAGGIVHRDISQHLAVQGDTGLQQAVDEAAVADTVGAGSRVDAGDPQRTEVALLLLAADVGVLARLDDRLLGDAIDLAAGVVIALRLVEDLLVTAARLDATLDSCHFLIPQRYGSMRSRRPASSARTWFVCRRLRFRLVAFLVRMWLRLAWPALYLPEAVLRKRLAAARLVLILGIANVLDGNCH